MDHYNRDYFVLFFPASTMLSKPLKKFHKTKRSVYSQQLSVSSNAAEHSREKGLSSKYAPLF